MSSKTALANDAHKLDYPIWQGRLPEQICQLRGLGLSCFGCCGYDWAPIADLRKQVSYNTWRFNAFYTNKEKFANSTDGVTGTGVCRAVVVLEDGAFGCPLHPAQNDGEDLRRGDCLTQHQCPTLVQYKRWNADTKRAFMAFITKKNYDSFEYSMANAKGTLLGAFKRTRSFRLKFKDFFR